MTQHIEYVDPPWEMPTERIDPERFEKLHKELNRIIEEHDVVILTSKEYKLEKEKLRG